VHSVRSNSELKTAFQVTRSNSSSTCVKQVCRSKFCVVAPGTAKAVEDFIRVLLGLVGGKKQSLGNVKMIVLDSECIPLRSEVRIVYSCFKLYTMREIALFNCVTVLKEFKM